MSYDAEAIESERMDADIETAAFEAEGRRLSRLHAKGICTHGWRQGQPAFGAFPDRAHVEEMRKRGSFPDRPTNYDIPRGYDLCLDCGQPVKSWLFGG